MKTKIFFVCLFLCFALQTKAQTEFAPIGAEWYYSHGNDMHPEYHFGRVVSEKDTVINGYNCRILNQYHNDLDTIKTYIIKQEQGRVYYYQNDQFNLLFDFEAEINDTIKFTFRYKEYYLDDFPLGKDTLFSARFRVESITTDVLQNFRTFKVKVLEEDIVKYWGIYVPDFLYYSYTEKIGLFDLMEVGSPNYREFIPILDNLPHPAVTLYSWLRCYSDTQISFVSDEWGELSLPCDYPINSNNNSIFQNGAIKVYPNPFSNSVFLLVNDAVMRVEIIDISGKVIYYSKLLKGLNEILTNHFLEGIYFIKTLDKNHNIQTFKIIKL